MSSLSIKIALEAELVMKDQTSASAVIHEGWLQTGVLTHFCRNKDTAERCSKIELRDEQGRILGSLKCNSFLDILLDRKLVEIEPGMLEIRLKSMGNAKDQVRLTLRMADPEAVKSCAISRIKKVADQNSVCELLKTDKRKELAEFIGKRRFSTQIKATQLRTYPLLPEKTEETGKKAAEPEDVFGEAKAAEMQPDILADHAEGNLPADRAEAQILSESSFKPEEAQQEDQTVLSVQNGSPGEKPEETSCLECAEEKPDQEVLLTEYPENTAAGTEAEPSEKTLEEVQMEVTDMQHDAVTDDARESAAEPLCEILHEPPETEMFDQSDVQPESEALYDSTQDTEIASGTDERDPEDQLQEEYEDPASGLDESTCMEFSSAPADARYSEEIFEPEEETENDQQPLPVRKRESHRRTLTEDELLEQLHKLFPNGQIYEDEYISKARDLMFAVHKEARIKGCTQEQWLTQQGFEFKKLGYVEPDMRYADEKDKPKFENAGEIADYVLKTYPLAGEYVPDEYEQKLLYDTAVGAVREVLAGTHVSTDEEAVVFVETVNLLKNWGKDNAALQEGGTFWKYIFLQYGFKSENSDKAENMLYAFFRLAIRHTCIRYHRFFAPKGTQRYYTTMMLHAMAPAQSILGFYNILFAFYVKNLDMQYISEDSGYKTFAKHMSARFDSNIVLREEMELHSEVLASGLRTLFLVRSGYMAVLSEAIVRKMDALLRGDSDQLDLQHNYWDVLLMDWFHEKSTAERAQVQGQRQQRKTEYVATTADRIYIKYVLHDERVGLEVPRIRLTEVADRRPVLSIYQDESCIFKKEMSVTGNEFCLTTAYRFVPLQDMDYDFARAPELRAVIEYNDKVLYTSGKKLSRQYLMFDECGAEHTPQSGMMYLFAGQRRQVDFGDDTDVIQCRHPGQLYRINLSQVLFASVDGNNVFVDAKGVSRVRHRTSRKCLSGIRAVDRGREIELYDASFDIDLWIPQGESLLRYQFALDEVRYTADQMEEHDGYVTIPSGSESGCIHSLRVIDLINGFVKYEYSYAILPGCRVEMNQPVCLDNGEEVSGTFWCNGKSEKLVLTVASGQNWASAAVRSTDLSLEIEIPMVHCTLDEKNAFLLPKYIWHEEIPSGALLHVTFPQGWEGYPVLDSKKISSSSQQGIFELGNELRAITPEENIMVLWLYMKHTDGEIKRIQLTDLVMKPCFVHSPLSWKQGQIFWTAEGNFFGSQNSVFQVEYTLPDGAEIAAQTSVSDCVLQTLTEQLMGYAKYTVTMQKRSLFSVAKGEVIHEGLFAVGDANEFRFKDKRILLRNAKCWVPEQENLKELRLRLYAGIITNLKYQGMDIASGETVEAPHYTGKMFFMDHNGWTHPFNADPDNKGFEQINPVNVWVINDYLLILHAATDDGVYVDNHYLTIVNRSPEFIMSKTEAFSRLEIPDYFGYEVKEV